MTRLDDELNPKTRQIITTSKPLERSGFFLLVLGLEGRRH